MLKLPGRNSMKRHWDIPLTCEIQLLFLYPESRISRPEPRYPAFGISRSESGYPDKSGISHSWAGYPKFGISQPDPGYLASGISCSRPGYTKKGISRSELGYPGPKWDILGRTGESPISRRRATLGGREVTVRDGRMRRCRGGSSLVGRISTGHEM